jgi:hypothetical protein
MDALSSTNKTKDRVGCLWYTIDDEHILLRQKLQH